MNRLRELDFLRGIAIILVLLRHIPLFSLFQNMGWIGVDLFFVLSGFLVSGLLFKEYIKYGNIKPKLFLIRRGYKIYPIYYLFYIPYLLFILYKTHFDLIGFLSDMTFTQNYIHGWGYAYGASWSLAVEEHFYFGLTLMLWLVIKYKKIKLEKISNKQFSINSFETLLVFIMFLSILLRLVFNLLFPEKYDEVRLFTTTQFRIDSLLMGVLISYFYYFRLKDLATMFNKYKCKLLVVSILGIVWTPFIDPVPSIFVKTIGFTILYISFGIILVFFLMQKDINQLLNKFLTPTLVNSVSRIGFCSYSIYIIHSFVIKICYLIIKNHQIFSIVTNKYSFFLLASTLSILIGMFMTYKIEKYFLKLRNVYYPSRV